MEIVIQANAPDLDLDTLHGRLEHVLIREGCPPNVELSVKLVDDEEIRHLHRQWMNLDSPTDVLSFEQDGPEAIKASGGHLGDVVVSLDTAAQQARDYAVTLEAEVTLLAVHGTLHLLGYDDREEADRHEMRAAERLYVPEAYPHKGQREQDVA